MPVGLGTPGVVKAIRPAGEGVVGEAGVYGCGGDESVIFTL